MKVGTVVLGLWCALAAVGAEPQSVTVAEPAWEALEAPPPPELRSAWREALATAADDLRGEVTLLTGKNGSAAVHVTMTGRPGAWAVILQRDAEAVPRSPKYLPFTAIETGLSIEFARALESLVRPRPVDPPASPVLVDTLSVAELLGVDLPPGASIQPTGLAVRSGKLVVAGGSTVVEMDDHWRVTGLPAKALSDAGQVNFAWGLAQTPAGTLYLRSVDGSAVWSLAEGAEVPQRVRVAAPAGSALGVLGDGSVFVVTTQPKLAQVWRAGAPLSLPLAADSAVFAAAAGPDNTLWLADAVRGQIRVVSAEGVLRDVVYPDLAPGSAILKLRVAEDGTFVAVTSSEVRRFDRAGRTVWSWDGSREGLGLSFSTYTDVVQTADGLWYLSDFLGKRLSRLAETEDLLPSAFRAVALADRRSRADSRRPEPFLALADAYRAMDAPEAERMALERYLELRPADGAALDRRLGVEVALLKAKAAAGEADTQRLASRYGAETAREAFTRAMKTLERVRALVPQDPEVPQRMTALRRVMDGAEGPSSPEPVPLVVSVDLPALFPSLLQAYRSKPAGTVVLRNTLNTPISDLRVELLLPKYMDFPSVGPTVARVAPGTEVRLDVLALLNDKVLDVEEDLPVQVMLTVKYNERGPRSFAFARSAVLYRRTALTWDDTGKLASFVTPNEETISRAAFQLLPSDREAPLISATLQRAAALCDALGALPLRYVPDPQASFAQVSADAGTIDTVRFPRTTLAYRGGDCDDTTALLASLLEASGIPTALVTSPGHVFLAFDTGEKADAAWLFEGTGLATVVKDGRVWLPLESTNLSQGFVASWTAASALVRRYADSPEWEFLTLASLRARYPALPLSPSSLPAPRPDPSAAAALRRTSADELTRLVYAPVSDRLMAERSGQKGAAWSRTSNRLAQLQARFDRTAAAEATLKAVVAADSGYVAAYLNLAVLSLRSGNRDEASRWVDAARAAAPNSARVAQFASQAGLADRGPALVQRDDSTGRAGVQSVPAWNDQ
jgi:hypothetical protein